jgi:hypothetical protein
MPIEASPEPLLVQEMGNQTDATTKDEEAVEDSHLQVVLGFLGRKRTAVAHKINKADSNATIDVEDQVVLLGSSNGLHSQRIVEHLTAGEVVLDVVLDKLDTKVRVVSGLDPVANTGN